MKRNLRGFDDLDIRISNELSRNGRLSNREISRRVGVSEGSVRQRIGRMIRSGELRIVAQANLEHVSDAFLAIVGLKIEGRKLNECAERIRELPAVLTTMIVTGRHDLLVTILAPTHRTLVEFVADELSAVPGIRDSETTVVLRTSGQWIDAERAFRLARPAEPRPGRKRRKP